MAEGEIADRREPNALDGIIDPLAVYFKQCTWMDLVMHVSNLPSSGGTSAPDLALPELLDSLPLGICTCDPSGRVTYYNAEAANIWGVKPDLSRGDLMWCGALAAFLPTGEPLPGHLSPMAELLDRREPLLDRELDYQRPDLSRITVLCNLRPRFSPTGDFLGGVNCFQDITERKRSEAREHRAQMFLQSIFETSPDCIKLVAVDGTLLQMNPSGFAMLEVKQPNDVIGGNVMDVISPEFRSEWRRNHDRVCAGEKLAWEFDIRGLHGTVRHMSTHAAPIELPDGSIAHLAITRDATKRKRNEFTIRESEHRLRQLLAALPAAVYTTDPDGRIEYFNDAAMELAGRRPEIGDKWRVWWKLYAQDGSPLPHDECPLAVTLKTGEPVRGHEAIGERPDGARRWFMPYPTPLKNSAGAVVGAINMLVDITDSKRAEREQKLLIDELNHRVKNTLASVQSFINLTSRGQTDVAAFRAILHDRIMAMSRAHDQLSRQNWARANLRDVAEAGLGPFLDRSGLTLEGPNLTVEPRTALMLSMALHELATNAAKFGALSVASGKASLIWQLLDDKSLRLDWRESGGPKIGKVTRSGFGTQLLQRGVALELGGKADCNFHLDGLMCAVEVPWTHAD